MLSGRDLGLRLRAMDKPTLQLPLSVAPRSVLSAEVAKEPSA
jgi:hypothetical protein